MTPPERFRALLAEPGFVVMPAVWDGLTARFTRAAGFRTAFLSGSCVAAGRLGGPDLGLASSARSGEPTAAAHARQNAVCPLLIEKKNFIVYITSRLQAGR